MKPAIAFGVIAGLGPLLWLLACATIEGDAFLTFHKTTSGVGSGYFERPWWYKVGLWPGSLLVSLGPIVLLCVVGIMKAFKRREAILLLVYIAIYYTPFMTLQVTGASGTSARATLFAGTMLFPFAAYALEGTFAAAPRKFLTTFFIAGVVWLAVVLALSETRWGEFSQKFASISPRTKERPHVTDVTRWLRQELKPTDRVLLDAFNDEESSLQFHVRLNPKQARVCWSDKTPPEQLLEPTPRFIVYAKGDKKRSGTMSKAMPLDVKAESQEKFGFRFTRRHENEVYVVFEVERLAATAP